MVIYALWQQEHFREVTKKVGQLTMDELRLKDGFRALVTLVIKVSVVAESLFKLRGFWKIIYH